MKKLSSKLARIPSITYLFAYFIAIPIFAFIYSSYPRAFKSSTTTLEPSILVQKEELAEGLKNEILNPSGLMPYYRVKVPTKTSIKIDDLNLYFGSFTPDSISGRLILTTVDSSNIKKYEWFGDFCLRAIKIDKKYEKRVYQKARPLEIDLNWARYPDDPITKEEQENLEYLVFKSPFAGNGLISFYVPRFLFNKFCNFFDTVKGLPAGFFSSYPRMLYLSTVTITTLGYGDIVPINRFSRSFVSLEALLGILIMGLFLNSLAHETARKLHSC